MIEKGAYADILLIEGKPTPTLKLVMKNGPRAQIPGQSVGTGRRDLRRALAGGQMPDGTSNPFFLVL